MALSGTCKRGNPTLKELLEILVRQAYCPECGEKLGALEGLHRDHIHQLAEGGLDTTDNQQFMHQHCHSKKTNGTKATTYGSDSFERGKTRRMRKKHAPAKDSGPSTGETAKDEQSPAEDVSPALRPRRRLQGRGFDKELTKGFDGKVRKRNKR